MDDVEFEEQLKANRKCSKQIIKKYLKNFKGADTEQKVRALCDLSWFAMEEMKELNK